MTDDPLTPEQLPAYSELILPTIRAVGTLGGSATAREVTSQVLEDLDPSEDALTVTQPNRPEASVYMGRVHWARSYAKLIGALESPKRGLFLITSLGEELLALPDEEAQRRTLELDREYRRQRRQRRASRATQLTDPVDAEEADEEESLLRAEESGASPEDWKDDLLARLHRLTPEGFEEFALFLLRAYGLQLKRVGRSGDEGIDGIGTAPISPVLSSRVAVQVKRYDPNGKPIGRDVVALFQRDAQSKGAERAIIVTLARFTESARKAATSLSPTVDLIDGDKIADLVRENGFGIKTETRVDLDWFNRFDTEPGAGR